jgi:hypothetical protein
VVGEPEKVTLYWPRGLFFWRPKAVYAKGCLLEGNRHGKWIYWYKNGVKQLEGEYLGDKKTGSWVKWYENGIKATEGEFLYGKMHGKWTDWHGNGKKALESYWVLGKRDGQWKSWNGDGTLKKTLTYDQKFEEDKGYSIHTDLETKEIIRDIQRRTVHGTWEGLVGKTVANFVKPWHLGCWTLLFIPFFAFVKTKTPWRSAAMAAILAFLVTSLLAWGEKKGRNDKK